LSPCQGLSACGAFRPRIDTPITTSARAVANAGAVARPIPVAAP
jgi:hypothetical protein